MLDFRIKFSRKNFHKIKKNIYFLVFYLAKKAI
jgi:hypothetical protein